ncbi:hypothetical protein PCYB_004390 [Plasmodium cynomolgi strain B]|uniref:Uncharacterized protein n=1 Tax=Plasmodium cynomolgi (strain B) TaxID=1120755 RepID=K6V2Z5_PLACD|nr:hypothetical protein PCYB_004390 [Plasmodium cynomolgi strain B]GAB69690.1 hypothetical protein PCYB_004390 [Plasmodium cynomolgi strain B]
MDEGCKYLYYSMDNNVTKDRKYNNDDKLKFYKKLLKEFIISQEGVTSNYTNILEINVDILEENNNLIEMYDNFDNFKNSLKNKNGIPCKYAEKCINIYEKSIKKEKFKEQLFPSKLNEFKERYYKHMEDYYPCDNLQNFFRISEGAIRRSYINHKKIKKERSINELLQESENLENNSYRRTYKIAYSLSE